MVELFAREGAQVLTCSRSEPKEPLPQGVSSLTADVSRSDEVKKAIGQECLELVKRYYHLHLSDALQITVKIDDIPLDFYFKDPAGTLNYQ